MFNVNRVTLLGNVTRDPDVRATKSGQAVTSIGFATNRYTKDDAGNAVTEPEFHNLVSFGKLAEFSGKTVRKGAPLYVEGRLHTSTYKNKDGKDAKRTEVVVDKLVLLAGRKGKAKAAADEE